ncbi:hypothetical protein SCARD494_06104 [Seiridium cardinale]
MSMPVSDLRESGTASSLNGSGKWQYATGSTSSWPERLHKTLQENNSRWVVRNQGSRPSIRYVAISHVWRGGLGNPSMNSLPACQLGRIQDLVNRLYGSRDSPVPLWIDTLCVPLPPGNRRLAIQNMKAVYQNADKVLVLDTFLESSKLSANATENLMRIHSSSWMQRLWTFQEGILAQSLYFQFAQHDFVRGEDLLDDMMKDRKQYLSNARGGIEDILEKPQEAYRSFKAIRVANSFDSKTLLKKQHEAEVLAQLSMSLEWRRTTRTEDEAVVLTNLLGLNTKDLMDVNLPGLLLTQEPRLSCGVSIPIRVSGEATYSFEPRFLEADAKIPGRHTGRPEDSTTEDQWAIILRRPLAVRTPVEGAIVKIANIKRYDRRRLMLGELDGRSLDESAAFLQQWLFWGLLESTADLAEFPIQRDKFLRTGKTCPKVVFTEPLVAWLRYWILQELRVRSPQEAEICRQGLIAYLKESAQVINVLTANHNCALSNPPGSGQTLLGSSTGTPTAAGLNTLLLCSLLGEAIKDGLNSAYSREKMYSQGKSYGRPNTKNSDLEIEWKPSSYLTHHLLQAGWCVSDVTVMVRKGGNSLISRLCLLSSIKKESIRRHEKCTPARCILTVVQNDDYISSHTQHCDIHGSKEKVAGHIAVQEDEIGSFIQNDQVPLLVFDDDEIKVQASESSKVNAFMHNVMKKRLPFQKQKDQEYYMWRFLMSGPRASATLMQTPCRAKAVSMMNRIYREADRVLVLDNDLLCQEGDAVELLARVQYSTWAHRLWTFQEGALAKKLYVQFRAKAIQINDIFETYEAEHHKLFTLLRKDLKRSKRTEGSLQSWLYHVLGELQKGMGFGYQFPHAAWPEEDMIARDICNHLAEHAVSPLYREAKRFYERLRSADQSLPKAELLAHCVEEIKWRTTSRLSDEILCLAILLKLQVPRIPFFDNADVLQTGSLGTQEQQVAIMVENNMAGVLIALKHIPLSLVFSTLPKMHKPDCARRKVRTREFRGHITLVIIRMAVVPVFANRSAIAKDSQIKASGGAALDVHVNTSDWNSDSIDVICGDSSQLHSLTNIPMRLKNYHFATWAFRIPALILIVQAATLASLLGCGTGDVLGPGIWLTLYLAMRLVSGMARTRHQTTTVLDLQPADRVCRVLRRLGNGAGWILSCLTILDAENGKHDMSRNAGFGQRN